MQQKIEENQNLFSNVEVSQIRWRSITEQGRLRWIRGSLMNKTLTGVQIFHRRYSQRSTDQVGNIWKRLRMMADVRFWQKSKFSVPYYPTPCYCNGLGSTGRETRVMSDGDMGLSRIVSRQVGREDDGGFGSQQDEEGKKRTDKGESNWFWW